MSDANEKKGLIRRFIDAPPDSVGKTIFVAVSLCLVASMVVELNGDCVQLVLAEMIVHWVMPQRK